MKFDEILIYYGFNKPVQSIKISSHFIKSFIHGSTIWYGTCGMTLHNIIYFRIFALFHRSKLYLICKDLDKGSYSYYANALVFQNSL